MKNKQSPQWLPAFLLMAFLAPVSLSIEAPRAYADGPGWEQAGKKPEPRKPRPKPGPTGEGDGD
ncbi:MAG: hypothetical protein JWN98_2740 [Abditibacteriota bacterium]|nr:hypothetical protein [Abditibacteriota bacterium]